MNLGDGYWVTLPDRGGHEQRGRRPAVIWQDTSTFPQLPTVLIIPLTTQLDTLRFGGTARIEPSAVNGLSAPSVALVFQLGACDPRRLAQRLGRQEDADLASLRARAIELQKLA